MGALGFAAALEACGGGQDAPTPTPTGSSEATTPAGSGSAGASPSGLARLFDEAGSCELAPEGAEGPFYFDVDRLRRDITEDRDGAPLELGIRVRAAGGGGCEPTADAIVDVWHTDAAGAYSGFTGGGPPGSADADTEGETFMRGAQPTDGEGIAVFETVYPGWYPGRTPHIHAKVHLDASTLLTTQLYFDEAISRRVYSRPPYASRGAADVTNSADGLYTPETQLDLRERGDGWLGLITLDVAG